MDTGRKAKEALIFEGSKYKNLNLTDAIAKYAPPSENNTAAYQQSVLGAVGGANKRMGDYTTQERAAIMDKMQQVEGFKVGKVIDRSGLGDLTTAAAVPTSADGSAAAALVAETKQTNALLAQLVSQGRLKNIDGKSDKRKVLEQG